MSNRSGYVRPRRPCRQCGEWAENRGGGQCGRCYQYTRRHGHPRPDLDRPMVCRVCAVPLLPNRRYRGRCHSCYVYWLRHGKRAERVWLIPPPAAVVRPAPPTPRPPRPANGWHWDGQRWEPPERYCDYGQDFDRKPLCGVCGLRAECGGDAAHLAAWRRGA